VQRCAGLGWAKDAHRVCVLGGDGNSLLQRSFVHDERDLNGMCELLVGLGVKRLAIERPHGIVVERLLEAGLIVLPIHPNQLKAARPRFRAAGGKSDSFDAFCLAELARTDHRRFRVLAPDSDETKALRALTRACRPSSTPSSGRVPPLSSVGSTRRSRRLSSSAIRAPQMPRLRARSASLASSPTMATAEESPPRSFWPSCDLTPGDAHERKRRRHAGLQCSRCSPSCDRSSSRSGFSNRGSPAPCGPIPTARSSPRSFATPTRRSPPLRSSPRSATDASAIRAPRRWRQTPACPR
jgi:hypothetical protein